MPNAAGDPGPKKRGDALDTHALRRAAGTGRRSERSAPMATAAARRGSVVPERTALEPEGGVSNSTVG